MKNNFFMIFLAVIFAFAPAASTLPLAGAAAVFAVSYKDLGKTLLFTPEGFSKIK